MKTTLILNQEEVAQAVADYVAKKLRTEALMSISFSVTATHDPMDRPTGGHTITASATLNDESEAKP